MKITISKKQTDYNQTPEQVENLVVKQVEFETPSQAKRFLSLAQEKYGKITEIEKFIPERGYAILLTEDIQEKENIYTQYSYILEEFEGELLNMLTQNIKKASIKRISSRDVDGDVLNLIKRAQAWPSTYQFKQLKPGVLPTEQEKPKDPFLFKHKEPTQIFREEDLLKKLDEDLPSNDPRMVRLRALHTNYRTLLSEMFNKMAKIYFLKEIPNSLWDKLPLEIRTQYQEPMIKLKNAIRKIYESFPVWAEQYKQKNPAFYQRQKQRQEDLVARLERVLVVTSDLKDDIQRDQKSRQTRPEDESNPEAENEGGDLSLWDAVHGEDEDSEREEPSELGDIEGQYLRQMDDRQKSAVERTRKYIEQHPDFFEGQSEADAMNDYITLKYHASKATGSKKTFLDEMIKRYQERFPNIEKEWRQYEE